ncbi:MAG: TVP38/TMEM64 family protein [Crocosphaera sp.]|nr:TVP38/TMEM64 family protein [Crocosphaera sp.]
MFKSTKITQLLIKFGGIAVLIASLIIVAKQLGIAQSFNINETLQNILRWIDSLGTIGYFAFIIVYVLAAVFLISGAILTLGAGAIFDVVKGCILVSIASVLGATFAFLIGRYLMRGWVSEQIKKYPKFQAVDDAVAKEGWKIVGLTRLSPVFPFVILNYAFGITQVSLKDYILASWIGMMPGTIMYVYIGSLIGNIATLGAGGREKTPLEWGLYIIGLIATVLVTVYVTKIAKKALNNQLENP